MFLQTLSDVANVVEFGCNFSFYRILLQVIINAIATVRLLLNEVLFERNILLVFLLSFNIPTKDH